MTSQGLAKVKDIVGREAISAHDGEMAGEIHKEAKQRAIGRTGRQDTHVGINGTRRLDDVSVPFAGMGHLPAIAHQEAPIEADTGLVAESLADLGGMERVIGGNDGLRDPLDDQVDVFGISLRPKATRDRPTAVGVARSQQHVRAGNLGRLGDRLRVRRPWVPHR